jgi:NADH dehydrogenase FAD-containing subunit
MNPNTRQQAIAIAAAIFAVRDLANCREPRESRATRAIEEAVSKARYLVEVIERKLAAASDATGRQK